MPSVIYDQFGIPRKIEHLNAVERLETLKAKHGANVWPVIEEVIKVWEKTNPKEWQSYLFYIDELRHTRKDKKYASTKDPVHGGYLRYTLDIPEKVMYMLRCLYTPEELPMDRKFFLAFARKFPRFKVAERL